LRLCKHKLYYNCVAYWFATLRDRFSALTCPICRVRVEELLHKLPDRTKRIIDPNNK
jgi:hypothetical protein